MAFRPSRSLGNLSLILPILAFGSNDFDYKLAQQYASVASATYCDDLSVVENWTCVSCQQSGFKLVPGKVKVVDAGLFNSARVIIGKVADEESCLLSFRGTDNWENWFRDLEFWHELPSRYEHCDGCKVHNGFTTVWHNLRGLVMEALGNVGCPWFNSTGQSYNIYISGHSLGGAVGQLAMLTLDEMKYKLVSAYFFEAPRLGNQAFHDHFVARFKDIPVYRTTHYKDPVIHLPPKMLGFVHAVTEVYFNKTGSNYTVCSGETNSSGDPRCADQFSGVYDLLSNSGDHCTTPLLPNKNLCWPPGCLYNSTAKMAVAAGKNWTASTVLDAGKKSAESVVLV